MIGPISSEIFCERSQARGGAHKQNTTQVAGYREKLGNLEQNSRGRVTTTESYSNIPDVAKVEGRALLVRYRSPEDFRVFRSLRPTVTAKDNKVSERTEPEITHIHTHAPQIQHTHPAHYRSFYREVCFTLPASQRQRT